VASRLDAHFAASKLAKPLLLLAVTFLLIVLSAFGCMLMGADLGEGLWQSWLFAADPGTHADVESGGLRAVAIRHDIRRHVHIRAHGRNHLRPTFRPDGRP
jgi:hypothetical protein